MAQWLNCGSLFLVHLIFLSACTLSEDESSIPLGTNESVSSELAYMLTRVTSDSISESETDAIVEQITFSPELISEVQRGLFLLDDEKSDKFALIYLAGRSHRREFSEALQFIASRPSLKARNVSEASRDNREMERLASYTALRQLGEVDVLEELYLRADEHLKTSLRLELFQLDSEKWPMRELPSEILQDYRADPGYSVEFARRLKELSADGVVILDDVVQGSFEGEDEVGDSADDSMSPPVVNEFTSDFSSRRESAPKEQNLKQAAVTTSYSCGETSPARRTSDEISHPTWEWCNNQKIADYWNGYNFNNSWNSSMGYDSPCDLNMALGRTLNAIHLLHTASPSPPVSYSDMSGDILRWGGNYARREIPKMKASCETKFAASVAAKVIKKNRHLTMFLPSFYWMSTAERAAVLIHETRHTERCRHNGNDGSNKCPSRSNSCDESMYDGCKNLALAPNGAGAVGFEINWIQAYLTYAPANKITPYQRQQVRTSANDTLNRYLDVEPWFNFSDDGNIYYYSRGENQ